MLNKLLEFVEISFTYDDHINNLSKLNAFIDNVDTSKISIEECYGLLNKSSKLRNLIDYIVKSGDESYLQNAFIWSLSYCYNNIIREEERKSNNNEYIADSIYMYLREISNISIKDQSTLAQLLERSEQGDKSAYNEIVESFLRQCAFVAKNYITPGVSYEDLIQDGNIGLINSIKGYDISRNVKFATYINKCLRNSIANSYFRLYRKIYIPTDISYKIYKIYKIEKEHLEEYGKYPTDEYISKKQAYHLI